MLAIITNNPNRLSPLVAQGIFVFLVGLTVIVTILWATDKISMLFYLAIICFIGSFGMFSYDMSLPPEDRIVYTTPTLVGTASKYGSYESVPGIGITENESLLSTTKYRAAI